MRMINGETVMLTVRSQTGVDDFHRPVYSETQVAVDNVLIAPVSGEEFLDTLNLTGKRAVYQLAIPKCDTNAWDNATVVFWGQTWRCIGAPTEGMEGLIPLDWNKKVKVEYVT